MPTLSIELPETAYRAALSFPPHERTRLAAVMFTTAEAALGNEEPDYDRETSESDLEAIGRGLADVASGRTISGDVVFAQLREQLKKK
jgi:hypothetical protein